MQLKCVWIKNNFTNEIRFEEYDNYQYDLIPSVQIMTCCRLQIGYYKVLFIASQYFVKQFTIRLLQERLLSEHTIFFRSMWRTSTFLPLKQLFAWNQTSFYSVQWKHWRSDSGSKQILLTEFIAHIHFIQIIPNALFVTSVPLRTQGWASKFLYSIGSLQI